MKPWYLCEEHAEGWHVSYTRKQARWCVGSEVFHTETIRRRSIPTPWIRPIFVVGEALSRTCLSNSNAAELISPHRCANILGGGSRYARYPRLMLIVCWYHHSINFQVFTPSDILKEPVWPREDTNRCTRGYVISLSNDAWFSYWIPAKASASDWGACAPWLKRVFPYIYF